MKGKIVLNKKVIISITVMLVLFLLTGFMDTAPSYTVEQLDRKYGTSIADLAFFYQRKHHYSLLKHDKIEYVFRGTKQYSHYFNVTVRVADQKEYISEKIYADVKKTMTLNVKGHEAEIRVLSGLKGYCNSADADVRLTNGHIRVEIITNDNMDIEGYWQNNPISDSSYMAIFEDIFSIILKE